MEENMVNGPKYILCGGTFLVNYLDDLLLVDPQAVIH